MATIAGLFQNYKDADQAIKDLNKGGFGTDAVSIVVPKNMDQKNLPGDYSPVSRSAKTTAKTGAVFGGLAGLLVGVSAIFVPGIGPVLSVGTLATALASTAAGAGVGAASGGILGALVGMGIPSKRAKVYAEGVKNGGILITIIAEQDQILQVEHVLASNHAVEIQDRPSSEEKGTVLKALDKKGKELGKEPPSE